jgi:hypothetical protein
MKHITTIDEDYIQTESNAILDRQLSPNECLDVFEKINEKLWMVIQDSIREVIDFNRMMKKNRNADKKFPHYRVYWRNENNYEPKFKQLGTFKSEEDARHFVHRDIITEFDEWRIVKVEEWTVENEVYKINQDTSKY